MFKISFDSRALHRAVSPMLVALVLSGPLVPVAAQEASHAPRGTSPYESGYTDLVVPVGATDWLVNTSEGPLIFSAFKVVELPSIGERLRATLAAGTHSPEVEDVARGILESQNLDQYGRKIAILSQESRLIVGTMTDSPEGVFWVTLAAADSKEEAQIIMNDFIALQHGKVPGASVPPGNFGECPCEDQCNAIFAIQTDACRGELATCLLAVTATELICTLACAAASAGLTPAGSAACIVACILGADVAYAACYAFWRICGRAAMREWKVCLKYCDQAATPVFPPSQ